MSGKPNELEIEALREAAARVRELDTESTHLRTLIAAHTTRLEAVHAERQTRSTEVVELLRRMDVAADGNFGWENRVVWFLSELATSAEQYGRTHQ